MKALKLRNNMYSIWPKNKKVARQSKISIPGVIVAVGLLDNFFVASLFWCFKRSTHSVVEPRWDIWKSSKEDQRKSSKGVKVSCFKVSVAWSNMEGSTKPWILNYVENWKKCEKFQRVKNAGPNIQGPPSHSQGVLSTLRKCSRWLNATWKAKHFDSLFLQQVRLCDTALLEQKFPSYNTIWWSKHFLLQMKVF